MSSGHMLAEEDFDKDVMYQSWDHPDESSSSLWTRSSRQLRPVILQSCRVCTRTPCLFFPLEESGRFITAWCSEHSNRKTTGTSGRRTRRTSLSHSKRVSARALLERAPPVVGWLGRVAAFSGFGRAVELDIKDRPELRFGLTRQHTYTHVHPLIALPGNGLILLRHSNGESAGN